MILLNLALKNVKKNLSHYLLYFLSTVTCITIYFIFASLKYAPSTITIADASAKIAYAMKSVSLVILVFVALFIGLTNTFFVRSRKKEIGVYTFCGMKPGHVALMLFIENMLMGVFATILGICFGILLSRLANMLLIQMMDMSAFVGFYIAPKALLETVGVFGAIFLITSVTSGLMVFRFKIIELMQASKSEEQVPKHSDVKAVLGLSMMILGYADSQLMTVIPALILPIMLTTLALTIAGTYFFFSAFTLFWLKRKRQQANHIYKGDNLLATNHLMFRIQHNAKAMATIAVLAATTITAFGTALTLTEEMANTSAYYVPYHIQTIFEVSADSAAQAAQAQLKFDRLMATMSFKVKQSQALNMPQFSPEVSTDVKNFNPRFFKANDFVAITADQLKSLSALRTSPPLTEALKAKLDHIKPGSALFLVTNFDSFQLKDWRNENHMTLSYHHGDSNLALEVSALEKDHWFPGGLYKHIIIVSPEDYAKLNSVSQRAMMKVYMVDRPELTGTLQNNYATNDRDHGLRLYTVAALNTAMKADRGITLFITIFICLIFVLASGSVIYFKQLTDAVGEVQKYETLYKLGMHPEEARAVISKQLRLMFGAPYVVAVLHSAFALTSLSKLMFMPLWHIGAIACFAFLVLYAGFYLATRRSYLNIVWPYTH